MLCYLHHLFFLYLQADVIDSKTLKYNGIDHVKPLIKYVEEMNLGNIEFSVFQCKSKSNIIPAYYANIKVNSFFFFLTICNT